MKLKGDRLPTDLSIREALQIYLRRREVQIALYVLAAIAFYLVFRR